MNISRNHSTFDSVKFVANFSASACNIAMILAAVFAVAGCGGDRCAHDTCEPGSELDAVVDVPDTVATGDAGDAAGVDVARDGVVTDAGDAVGGDVAGDVADDPGSVVEPPYQMGCRTCTLDADCGQGAACVAVGAEKHCLNECVDDGDCAKGFVCYQAVATQTFCLPSSFECTACVFDEPCDAGKCCDFITGTCKDCGTECYRCTHDYDCADGYRCFREEGASMGICVPECVNGACDAASLECVKNARGVEMCQPTSDGCGGCSGATPWPLDGDCVGCRDRMDCGDGQACLDATHVCAEVECLVWGQVPCGDGQCHECCDDSDCAWREGATGICLDDRTCQPEPDCQGLCTMDFPYCVWVAGVAQCVQCVDDYDCLLSGFAECSCTGGPLYSCVDQDGAACWHSSDGCTSSCNDSEDCPTTADGTAMQCVEVAELDSSLCVDPSGHCDGVSACCDAGQGCYDLVLVLQEIYPTVPRLIDPPDVTLTYCECDTADDCLAGGPCTELSILCTSGDFPMEGMYEIICPDGQLHSAFPDRLCVEPATLLGYFGLVPAT